MQLRGIEVSAGERPGRVRVQGRVRYDVDGLEEVIWFDLPDSLAGQLSSSGNPWLVALLPAAITLGEPLRMNVPVDEVLLEGCRTAIGVWSTWYPHLAPIAIEAGALRPPPRTTPAGTGLFFSGGVDSFYSLISHNSPASTGAAVPVTDLILMLGADIPVTDIAAFDRLRPRIAEVAGEFGVGMVDIATNMRETRWGRADWPHLSHASLLAAAGLVLEPRLARLLIASSAPYSRLRPFGSHPITDPLFSTSLTRVAHDGAEQDRPDKILSIGAHPAVLKHLRVCWIGRSDSNCGRCQKCFHTMLGLELAGTLGQCRTLPREIDPSVFRRLYFESQGTYSGYAMLRQYRQRLGMAGRRDLVRLLDQVLAHSDRLRLTWDIIDSLARRGFIPERLSAWLIARMFRSTVKY